MGTASGLLRTFAAMETVFEPQKNAGNAKKGLSFAFFRGYILNSTALQGGRNLRPPLSFPLGLTGIGNPLETALCCFEPFHRRVLSWRRSWQHHCWLLPIWQSSGQVARGIKFSTMRLTNRCDCLRHARVRTKPLRNGQKDRDASENVTHRPWSDSPHSGNVCGCQQKNPPSENLGTTSARAGKRRTFPKNYSPNAPT